MCENNFDLDRGLIMTTGSVSNAVGPNNSGDNSQEWNEIYEDSFLQNIYKILGLSTMESVCLTLVLLNLIYNHL